MAPVLDLSVVPRRRLETRVRRYRGRFFVGNAEQAFELNEVAEFIFKQFDGVATLRQICERVARELQITLEEAIVDTRDVLSRLVECGIVEIAAGPAAWLTGQQAAAG